MKERKRETVGREGEERRREAEAGWKEGGNERSNNGDLLRDGGESEATMIAEGLRHRG